VTLPPRGERIERSDAGGKHPAMRSACLIPPPSFALSSKVLARERSISAFPVFLANPKCGSDSLSESLGFFAVIGVFGGFCDLNYPFHTPTLV
jgi:hypothetical protein